MDEGMEFMLNEYAKELGGTLFVCHPPTEGFTHTYSIVISNEKSIVISVRLGDSPPRIRSGLLN